MLLSLYPFICHQLFNSCVLTDFAVIVYQLLLSNWQNGWTALMSAAQNGHKNVVDTLLHHGARVDLTIKVSAAESLQPMALNSFTV